MLNNKSAIKYYQKHKKIINAVAVLATVLVVAVLAVIYVQILRTGEDKKADSVTEHAILAPPDNLDLATSSRAGFPVADYQAEVPNVADDLEYMVDIIEKEDIEGDALAGLAPIVPVTPVVPKPAPVTVPVIKPVRNLKWGAYIGNDERNIATFERLVGQKMDIYANFEGWHEEFPLHLKEEVGAAGKTLLIFWEPSYGYDQIIDGSKNEYIREFALDAKAYGHPIILVPFPEMNLNEEAWGYSINGNTAAKFVTAWRLVHGLFSGVNNVKFGLAYNNVSVPNEIGNRFEDYYPGSEYVDYVGVDGFNFTDPGLSFSQIFNGAMVKLAAYKKPIVIFSMGSIAGPSKADWIRKGLGERVYEYGGVIAWVWFNQGGSLNWLVDSDPQSLEAFKEVIPKD